MKASNVKIIDIRNNKNRCDASYHLSEGEEVTRIISQSPYVLTNISKVSSSIFYGNRAKRVYVYRHDKGIPFLSSSDILRADLSNVKLASKKYTVGIDQMILEKGWILITRSGTVGNCAFSNNVYAQKMASEHVIRLVPNGVMNSGMVYAYLASKYGYSLLTQGTFGAVIQHIEPDFIGSLPIPVFPKPFQEKVDTLIQESAKLREETAEYLNRAQLLLKEKANLPILTPEYYDYYGPADPNREVSTFVRNRKEIDTTTLNAFNHSERIRGLERMIGCECCHLEDVLLDGEFFSSGSFPRVEVKDKHGIMLINQSDIFDNIIKGKYISKRGVKTNNLVEYGEVMIAGVGTLGENETFCRTIFANEDLEGQLVSGEFLRMKTNGKVPSGYLYAWLSSDYGFRLIRSTQTGTKLCRPIQKLLLKKKIPIIDSESMNEIDELVREAHTKRHKANQMELKAISMVEQEIEKWSN